MRKADRGAAIVIGLFIMIGFLFPATITACQSSEEGRVLKQHRIDNLTGETLGPFTYGYDKKEITSHGMSFLLFYKKDQSSQTGYSIFTINLTKDSLEIEFLKKQLSKHK